LSGSGSTVVGEIFVPRKLATHFPLELRLAEVAMTQRTQVDTAIVTEAIHPVAFHDLAIGRVDMDFPEWEQRDSKGITGLRLLKHAKLATPFVITTCDAVRRHICRQNSTSYVSTPRSYLMQ
jgi:hypothetical protein